MESVVGRGTLLAGRYRTLAPLASDLPGASSWEANDQILDRPVRVTVLHGGHVPQALDAARRAALVADPRLVRVLDVGEHEGVAYTVTEQVAGPSLAELVARGPLPADQARAIVGEAAAALEGARRRGVHHLALRPSVLHLTPDDRVLVTGLAVDGALLGRRTPDADSATRTDTLGLVALLYAALTGRWPGRAAGTADGPLPQLAAAPVLEGAPVPPAELVSGVPNDLDTLCAVTLGVHDDGPRTPAELVQELEPWGDIRATDLFAGTRVVPVAPPTAPTAVIPARDVPAGPVRVQRTSVRTVFAGGSTAMTPRRPGTPPPAVPRRSSSITGPAVGAAGAAAAAAAAGAGVAAGAAGVGAPTASPAPRRPAPEVAATARPESTSPPQQHADSQPYARPQPQDRPEVAPGARPATAGPTRTTAAAAPAATVATGTSAAPAASARAAAPQPSAAPTAPDDDATVALPVTSPGSPTPRPAAISTPTAAAGGAAATAPVTSTARGGAAAPTAPSGTSSSTATPAAPAAGSATRPPRAPARPAVRTTTPRATDTSPDATARTAGATGAAAGLAGAAGITTAGPAGASTASSTAPTATGPEAAAASDASGDRVEPPALLPLGTPDDRDTPRTREVIAAHRFDPTRFVLLVVGLLIVVGLFTAYRALTRPVDLTVDPQPVASADAPVEEPAAEDPAAEDPAPGEEPPATTPVIASAAQLDPPPDGDENEHPEAVPLAIDGDPATAWFTRTYNQADFGGLKTGVGYAVTLAEPATVSTVTLQVLGSGGRVEVRATDPTTPTQGDVLAEGPLGPETVLTLSTPTETQHVVLWFTELPQTADGANRIELAEVTLS